MILVTARGWGILQGISTGLMGEKMMIPIIFSIRNSCHFLQAAKSSHVEGFIYPSFLNDNHIPSIDIFHISFIYTCMYLFCIFCIVSTRIAQPGTRPTCSLPRGSFLQQLVTFLREPPGVGLYIHDLILGPPFSEVSSDACDRK